MIHLLGTSAAVSGSTIDPDGLNGVWVPFDFSSPVVLTSGKTVILISRIDPENDDTVNHLKINNFYDSNDEENDQANVHYGIDTIMKGRGPGDEDQPEPFAVNIRLYGSNYIVSPGLEYPAQPLNLTYTSGSSAGVVDLSWDDKNAAVSVLSIMCMNIL